MLKDDGTRSKGLGVRRCDKLVDQAVATKYLHSHLERITGASTEDSGVKIEIVSGADICRDDLSKSVPLRVATGAETG